jgi:hypothetical protein
MRRPRRSGRDSRGTSGGEQAVAAWPRGQRGGRADGEGTRRDRVIHVDGGRCDRRSDEHARAGLRHERRRYGYRDQRVL